MKFEIKKDEQGSPQWHQARLGKVTASNFDKIITKTGKKASSIDDQINRAVAEIITGEPHENFMGDAMLRGKEMEDEAFNTFNFAYDLNVIKCGFAQSLDDNGKELYFGFSPDGLHADYGCEIKCPMAHTHLGYLAGDKFVDKYKQQVQGSMALSGKDRWFFGSYHPSFPNLALWVKRDDEYCKLIIELLEYCDEKIREKVIRIKELQSI